MLFNDNLYKFSTDSINIYSLNLDSSDSMYVYTPDMKKGIEQYKKSFKNFSESKSMAIAVNTFATNYVTRAFKGVDDFSINYRTDGATVLYYAIVEGAKNLLEYIKRVTELNNCIPRATFIVFSDGESCRDKASLVSAKTAIKKLNDEGVTTVFVAFGNSIEAKFGDEMGFVSTIDVNDTEKLVSFMGEELSKRCKEQTKSMRSLGSEFFSHMAKKSHSAIYDAKEEQALEEESWFDDI